MTNYLFTSESVSEGHPDKVADQISDSIVDAILNQDNTARIACETLINTGMVILSGEITTSAVIDYDSIVRNTIRDIGYTSSKIGFDADSCAILVSIDKQSPDIAQGVNVGEGLDSNQGAGDQGIMFGYACNETKELMPFPIMYAHLLVKKQAEIRKKGLFKCLRPDAKTQITVAYEDNKLVGVDAIVFSTQHSPDISHKEIEKIVIENIIKPVIPKELLHEKTRYLINPTGRFVIGGPVGDCGLTGRKIIVDTYGGIAHHGGGAFSGKDPSKVDRSAAYAARYVAKNIVAAKIANRCEIQLSYAIGVSEPTSINVNTFGTGIVDNDTIINAIRKCFDLSPKGIIKMLDLLRPIYRQTSTYGHFGRSDIDLPWEKLNKVEILKKLVI